MSISVTQHWQIFKIQLINVFQFRLRALVWFAVGSVNAVILLLFWWATLQASGGGGQVTLPAITSYYVLMLTIATATVAHIEEEISLRDVYRGNIYGYLLRPYAYLLIKFQEEVVWRLLAGFWAVLLIVILFVTGLPLVVSDQPLIWGLALLSGIGGIVISFFLKSILGLTSIWLTNIRGLSELFLVIEIVLAGFVVPLTLLPQPLQTIAYLSPFAAITYFPVSLLTRPVVVNEILLMFGLQALWLLILGIGAQFMLRAGIRHYTGVSQ